MASAVAVAMSNSTLIGLIAIGGVIALIAMFALVADVRNDRRADRIQKAREEAERKKILSETDREELKTWRTFIDAMITEATLASEMDVFAFKFKASVHQTREAIYQHRQREINQ